MRITGGIHRSRKLNTPSNDAVRPTSDKVRQALFNMLNSRGVVRDSVVIDGFCGTGALGLEALSRGAVHCIFIDKARLSVDLTRQNIDLLNVQSQSTVMPQDSTKLTIRPDGQAKANLVFLDPPYNKGLVEQSLSALQSGDWLVDNAFIVIEMGKDEVLDCPNFIIEAQKTYGDTQIILGRLSASLKATIVNKV